VAIESDFPISRRGYERAAVDAHLRAVTERFEERRRAGTVAWEASEQVRAIVAAAERDAADVRGRAEAQARATALRAEYDVERVRADAVRRAEEHVAEVRAAIAELLGRVEALGAEALAAGPTSHGGQRRGATALPSGAGRRRPAELVRRRNAGPGRGHAGLARRPLTIARRPLTIERVAGLALIYAVVMPAGAGADAEVRFAHAIPRAGAAELEVAHPGHAVAVGTADFGEVGAYRGTRAGAVTLRLVPPDGGAPLVTESSRLRDDRRYTVVALLAGERPRLHVYADAGARSKVARLRVVHAAPELGSPDLAVDGRTVARGLAYQAATPYLSLEPGSHRYAARTPAGERVLSGRVEVEAGTAYTGLVVGSRGERVRVVTSVDDEVTPAEAPGTPSHHHPSTYVVRSGDSLWAIAREHLGEATDDAAIARHVLRIWNASRERIGTGDPDLIYPGTRLRLS